MGHGPTSRPTPDDRLCKKRDAREEGSYSPRLDIGVTLAR